jgi:hypothetical protein
MMDTHYHLLLETPCGSAFRHWGIRGITGLQACSPKDRKR